MLKILGTVAATLVTEPPEPVLLKVPAVIDKPLPMVISSAAPVLAVVRPNILAVAIVKPLADA
jgi:hypothetical protein